jgi:energy-coupling factor transport system ATP-binding protein
MVSAPAIEVQRVTHVYPGGNRALEDVSLTIHRGELLALIGQNGSGKTTLAKHLNGMLKPTYREGSVLVNTTDGSRLDTRTTPLHRFASHVMYVFQNPDRQIFHDSVASELGYGLRNTGVTGVEAARRIEEALDRVGLSGTEQYNPFRMSRGQRQRLSIASAMVMRPAVLIVDEPTTGQDRAEGRHILEVLQGYNAGGNTVVIISHDMALVAQYATRIVAMRAGRVLADGDPRSVFKVPETLRLTNITPPQVAVFGLQVGLPGLLTVAEAVERIVAELGIRAGNLDQNRDLLVGRNEFAGGQGGA